MILRLVRHQIDAAKFALCNGYHPANYKVCIVYRDLIIQKNKTNLKNLKNTLQKPNLPTSETIKTFDTTYDRIQLLTRK